jgi:CotH kinase protein
MNAVGALRASAMALLGLALALTFGPMPAAADDPSRGLKTTLPIVAIQSKSKIKDARKVTARMRVIDGPGLNRVGDDARGYEGLIGIEVRGSTSQRLPKKQYSVETRKRGGDNREVRLLGLPKEEDWILHAPYRDRSLVRNVSAYAFSSMLGRYASRTRFVEVVLNGRYQGVYVLMEKLELGSKRVKVDDGDRAEPFLVERSIDQKLNPGDATFRLPVSGLPVIWTDPERSDMSRSEAHGVKRFISDFERALYGQEFRDPTHGYAPFLDLPVAVDYVLVNELFKNRDTFESSFYMHGRTDMPLRLGPVWDFDWSSASVPWMPEAERSPEGWIGAERPWSERLYGDPAFMRAVADRWREVRAQGLLERLDLAIQRYARDLRRPAVRDYRRWKHPGSLESEVGFLRSWLGQRTAWIDANAELAAAP